MGSLTQFQQNRRVIQDFTSTTLAMIPSAFARLTYMASLRDLSSGRYEHAGLTALYPLEATRACLPSGVSRISRTMSVVMTWSPAGETVQPLGRRKPLSVGPA